MPSPALQSLGLMGQGDLLTEEQKRRQQEMQAQQQTPDLMGGFSGNSVMDLLPKIKLK